jgi:hypothetical protein
MKLTGLGILLLLTTAAAHAGEFPKCFDASRDGHCIAVSVNGQSTVRLTKKTKKMLEAIGGVSVGGGDTRYEVPQPISGELALRAEWLPEAVGYFGVPPEVTIHVLALEGQQLETRPELSSAPSVRAGGSAVVTQADVVQSNTLQSNTLPPGKYVLTVRVSGARQNWDRQTLFVQVAK